jgi:hypothetical protein
MTAVVMRQFDDAIDFSLPASTASSSRGGDGRRVSTGFVEGEEKGGGKPWAARGFVADVASEMTA